MLLRKRGKSRSAQVDTLVGQYTVVEGNVRFSGGLHVEGAIRGDVYADDAERPSILILNETGRIEGEVNVPRVVINGTVEGDVHASDRVELAPKARITGSVYYHLIEMAMGAEVNGSLVKRSNEKPRLEYIRAADDVPEPGEPGPDDPDVTRANS
jgi:cytoskeletal protein CcmA (bactofilin family)